MTGLADSVAETSVSTGTGSIVLTGAYGYERSFTTAIADGDFFDGGKVEIRIDSVDANGNLNGQWEVTESTYTNSTNTLTRGVFRSSSTGGRVDFAAGDKVVTLVLSSYRIKKNVNDSPFIVSGIDGGGAATVYGGEIGRNKVYGGHAVSVFASAISGGLSSSSYSGAGINGGLA